jgi:hypothetical protein
MDALDGNAIAGTLFEHFGAEMTAVRGICGHCGASGLIAELVVYLRAPGAVARCRSCGREVIVAVRVRGVPEVDCSQFELVEAP